MKYKFIEVNNKTSITNIDLLLNWEYCLNRDLDLHRAWIEAEAEAEISSDRLGTSGTDSNAYFDSNTLDSRPNVAAARTDSSLNFPTYEEFIAQTKSNPTAYTTTPSKKSSVNNFAVEVEFGTGTDKFTGVMKAAIEDAADVWEDAILQSNFSDGHTLTIEVRGENFGADGFEAVANLEARTLREDADGNLLPTEGNSTVNTNDKMLKKFANNREYFTNLMAHEFGHVMGIGTLWKVNDLIDTRLGGYRADTKAGDIYNTGKEIKTNIPLTTGQGKGSDDLHWQEEVFDNELMTHVGEAVGSSEPLSIMTLASLEDLGWNVDYRTADIFPDTQTDLA